jgi:putative tryptophan/tyrosine transport system substrate-binding protein
MFRRSIALGLALAIFSAPFAITAQQAKKVPKIGIATMNGQFNDPCAKAFLDGMCDPGYVEGRDFAMELRTTDGIPERRRLANAELAQLPVDVILVGVCGAPLNGARDATRTIPIVVMTCNDDMVETGVVASMRRPGGNVTGQSKLTPELAPKRLQMLKQAVPHAKRVAVLWNPAYSEFKADWRELRAAAEILGVTLHPVEFRSPDDFDAAFAAIARERVDALITFSDLLTWVYAKRIAALAAAVRLPAMTPFREVTDGGALMSYGPSITGMCRRAADFVVRILKGANPAEMAIEQPTRFEFVINLKAARALGLTIPPTMRLQADEIVEQSRYRLSESEQPFASKT